MAEKKGGAILIEEHSVEALFQTLGDIKEQTTKTNGRVTELERRSIGKWIADHQFRSLLVTVALVAILISDLRHPIVKALLSLVCK